RRRFRAVFRPLLHRAPLPPAGRPRGRARRPGDRYHPARLSRARRDPRAGRSRRRRMNALEAIRKELEGLAIDDHPVTVRQKSRDFYWYSPVLKRQLDHVTADLVVSPKSEEEVIRVLAAAYRHEVPVTPRGAGTGNYGQAMPLSGGIVLNLADMNRVKAVRNGVVTAEAGAIMVDIDRQTKAANGQEIRL